ncbi:MAG: SAM-dependent DNA methyltransferase [Alphaproteobacteria bacterium]|nr:SAM-dependent DNA methyltransferase [Alphaproteobacteria bacterium]
MCQSAKKGLNENKQIVSKARIANHGEVFTNPREVNAMLDMVAQETSRIDSRFLEPACGKGAFLTEILRRKLSVLRDRYRKSPVEYRRYLVLAVGSIYGIDILADNVADCRDALRAMCVAEYTDIFGFEPTPSAFIDAIDFILSKNIIHGDTLTLRRADIAEQPIRFSEWSLVSGDLFKRRDFYFSSLVDSDDLSLFATRDTGGDTWLPMPVREFPLTDYKGLKDAG